MMYFDMMDHIQIVLLAADAAHQAHPGYEGRLIDIITDEHVTAALKKYFGDCDEYSDDLLPDLLACYKRTDEIERMADDLYRLTIAGIAGGAL